MSKIKQLEEKLEKAKKLEIDLKDTVDKIKEIILLSTPENIYIYKKFEILGIENAFQISLAELRRVYEERRFFIERELKDL